MDPKSPEVLTPGASWEVLLHVLQAIQLLIYCGLPFYVVTDGCSWQAASNVPKLLNGNSNERNKVFLIHYFISIFWGAGLA